MKKGSQSSIERKGIEMSIGRRNNIFGSTVFRHETGLKTEPSHPQLCAQRNLVENNFMIEAAESPKGRNHKTFHTSEHLRRLIREELAEFVERSQTRISTAIEQLGEYKKKMEGDSELKEERMHRRIDELQQHMERQSKQQEEVVIENLKSLMSRLAQQINETCERKFVGLGFVKEMETQLEEFEERLERVESQKSVSSDFNDEEECLPMKEFQAPTKKRIKTENDCNARQSTAQIDAKQTTSIAERKFTKQINNYGKLNQIEHRLHHAQSITYIDNECNENQDQSNDPASNMKRPSLSLIDEPSVASIVMGNSIIEQSFRINASPYADKQMKPQTVNQSPAGEQNGCSILCSVDFLGSEIIEFANEESASQSSPKDTQGKGLRESMNVLQQEVHEMIVPIAIPESRPRFNNTKQVGCLEVSNLVFKDD